VIACDLQCEPNIMRIGAAGDGARSAIDRPVPDAPQLIESVGVGAEHTATQLCLQGLRERRSARLRGAVGCCAGRCLKCYLDGGASGSGSGNEAWPNT
jgi:hypothetical protein